MRNKIIFILWLLLVIILSGGAAAAESPKSGSIIGAVVDKENHPLPGATATLFSPILPVARTFITSEAGLIIFPALPPGAAYRIRVEMPGFKTLLIPGIPVLLGKTTQIRVEMIVTIIAETITVSPDSRLIDTRSAGFQQHETREQVNAFPFQRSLDELIQSVPGAVIADEGRRPTVSLMGGTARNLQVVLDGIPLNDPASSTVSVRPNLDIIDEVVFDLGGLPAETGPADGTVIHLVSKTGGERLSGQLRTDFSNEGLTEDLIPDETREPLGLNKAEQFSRYRDVSLSLSGPISPQKIWFFLNVRQLFWEKNHPFTPEHRLLSFSAIEGASLSPEDKIPFDLRHEEWMGFAKLNLQLTSNFRYSGLVHLSTVTEPIDSIQLDPSTAWSSTLSRGQEMNYATSHQFQWIPDQRTYVDIRGSFIRRALPLRSRLESRGRYSYYDDRLEVSWGNAEISRDSIRKKLTAGLSLIKYIDLFPGGLHEIKAGVEYEKGESQLDWYRQGGNPYFSYWNDFAGGNPYYYSTAGRIGRLEIYPCPGEDNRWDNRYNTHRLGAWLQDSFTKGRLTLNMGFRFDLLHLSAGEHSRPELRYSYPGPLQNPILETNALLESLIQQWHEDIGPISPWDALITPTKSLIHWTTLSPRFGLVYDLFGTGKTALKFSFSRTYEPVWINQFSAGGIYDIRTINYAWTDSNANGLMDLPGTDLYGLTSLSIPDPDESAYVEDLSSPWTNEWMVGLEHELFRHLHLGFRCLYRINRNIIETIDVKNGFDPDATDEKGLIWIPFNVSDPGWDGRFNTQDDNDITVYGLREDRPFPLLKGANPANARRDYLAFLFTLDKRMADNWQLRTSFLFSRQTGNIAAGYAAVRGQTSAFDNPNSLIFSWGALEYDRPLQLKILGSYVLPYDFMLSVFFQAGSGRPWQRTFSRINLPPSAPV
ncbi:MAG: carboxypeptidase regulatory-like domain-containing protein, partial [Candidatus Aminicenantes bacterium]|nr:carboxypeptidase regulatory-like domain-containing protein [Candidatus Aminicenantes bacterium]